MIDKKILHVVGVARVPGIRGQLVICSRRIPSNMVPHEVGITEIVIALNPEEVARGDDVDAQFRCDAEVVHNGKHLRIEYDTGSEGLKQVRERLAIIKDAGPVLWVTGTENRRVSVARIAPDNVTVMSLHEVLLRGEEMWGLV